MNDFDAKLTRILRDRRSGSTAIATRTCRLLESLTADPLTVRIRQRTLKSLEKIVSEFPMMGVLESLHRRAVDTLQIVDAESPKEQSSRLRSALRDFRESLKRNVIASAAQTANHVGAAQRFLTISASGAVLATAEAILRRPGAGLRDDALIVVCESRPAREGLILAGC